MKRTRCWRQSVGIELSWTLPACCPSLPRRNCSSLPEGLSADLPESVRVALVARPDQAKQAKLIEGIARNDGLFLSFFLDVEEATIWVKGMNFHERMKPQPAGNLVKV